jgi:hypothetical protein
LEITSSTASHVEPERLRAKWIASDEALHQPGDRDLVDHLGELARRRRPHQP